jgi:hypothetical protein
MGIFYPSKQCALHIPGTGPKDDPTRGHLFIVLTNKSNKGDHLLVPVCSIRDKHDKTCLLGKGDHKFITRPSFIMYARADLFETKSLIKQVTDGVIGYEGLLNEKIFARVCNGVGNSPFTTPAIENYYAQHKDI